MHKFLTIVLLVIATTMTAQTTPSTKIIYVGDPMCSWCYGLTDELTEVLDHFDGKAEIEFVMGGLRPYYEVPMKEMQGFLSDHWKHVNEASGQEFNYNILERTDLRYDTEPPCRAVVAVKHLSGKNNAALFFKKTQRAFYYDNKDMNQASSYTDLLEDTGIKAEAFTKAFDSDEMKALVKKDFQMAANLGVNSFPTLVVQHNGQNTIVARGYAKSAAIIANIDKVISQ